MTFSMGNNKQISYWSNRHTEYLKYAAIVPMILGDTF